ncbi:phosphotransferase [Paenibacillus sp. N3.4]|uniref:phosphotransferase n=1 Tax=Paenibacillus sp. N3.4 TaxID=2603222 RepID=UPI0011CA0907|nr:phosphotransferase [Paenibacillus sp. N3.4]TXK75465.1 phosphotransferase [Paenibacillus sp. N3.4]
MSLASHIEEAYSVKISRKEDIRDVHRLSTVEGRLICSKRYDIPKPEIDFITDVMIHLANSGFRYGPQVVPNNDGTYCFRNKGNLYMITDWVPGRHANFNEQTERKKALRTLAKLHRHAEFPTLGDVPAARERYAHLCSRIEDYRGKLLAYEVSGLIDTCVSLCDAAIRHLGKAKCIEAVEHEASVRAFVHGDYNYPNLIVDPQGHMHPIDFENASMQPRMTDLAHILQRNVAWKGNEWLRWIEYYDRFRPLSTGDRHLLFALLHIPYPLIRAIRLHKSIRTDPQRGS